MNMFLQYPDIVSVDQLAGMLNIGKSSAYALLRDKQIRHVKVGRKYIIPKSSVVSFVCQTSYNDNQIIDGGLQLVTKGVN